MDHKPEPAQPLDSRRTVFIGGVPRPTRASEIAHVVAAEFGGVCYVGIDIDPELKYPKVWTSSLDISVSRALLVSPLTTRLPMLLL